jgi:hypothetical protein
MDIFQTLASYAIIVWIVLPCLALLLLYLIIRTAIARGLRDHQLWMEKNRPSVGQVTTQRESFGQYLGFSRPPTEPPASVN